MSDPRDSLLVHQQPLRLGFDGHCLRSLGRDDLMFSPPQDFQSFSPLEFQLTTKCSGLSELTMGFRL